MRIWIPNTNGDLYVSINMFNLQFITHVWALLEIACRHFQILHARLCRLRDQLSFGKQLWKISSFHSQHHGYCCTQCVFFFQVVVKFYKHIHSYHIWQNTTHTFYKDPEWLAVVCITHTKGPLRLPCMLKVYGRCTYKGFIYIHTGKSKHLKHDVY